MSYFVNQNLNAPNVIEVELPRAELTPAIEAAAALQTVPADQDNYTIDESGQNIMLSAKRPRNWGSDIAWWSACNREGFAFFQSLFDRLDLASKVAPYVDFDHEIRMYSGFFVARKICKQEHFHQDWDKARNNGFTLLTPVTSASDDLGLAYINMRGEKCTYPYSLGKGLILGDGFQHSTATGESQDAAIVLSFNFGSDRMEYWPVLKEIAATQGRMHCRPDGQLVRDGEILAPD